MNFRRPWFPGRGLAAALCPDEIWAWRAPGIVWSLVFPRVISAHICRWYCILVSGACGRLPLGLKCRSSFRCLPLSEWHSSAVEGALAWCRTCNYCNTLDLLTMDFHHCRSKQQEQKQKAARLKYLGEITARYFPTSLCGVLVFGCALPPGPASPPPQLAHTTCSHILCHHTTCHHTTCQHTTCSPHNLFTHTHTTCSHTHTTCTHTHNLHTHTTCHHTTCSHTQLAHTHTTYSHTHKLLPHNLSPHNLSPHNLSTHNLLTTQLVHTHTHNLFTHTQLAHTHTTCTHTQLVTTQLAHTHTTCTHTHNLLTHTQIAHHTTCTHTQLVTTQLTHTQLVTTPIITLCGIYRAGLAPVARLGWVWCRGRRRCLLCRPGRRCTWRHRRAFCVAGMALIVLGWLRWRAWVGFEHNTT